MEDGVDEAHVGHTLADAGRGLCAGTHRVTERFKLACIRADFGEPDALHTHAAPQQASQRTFRLIMLLKTQHQQAGLI